MSNVNAIPNGMHTVTPHLVCAGAADAIEFYKKAFNATETSRLPAPNGKLMHASIRIGDSTVMLVDEMPEHRRLSHTYCRQGQQAARTDKARRLIQPCCLKFAWSPIR